ncbi:50S ribosomal protein L23 [bacterium]|jgi:large subunit ribosomal protein L23|nr:50S ribosomal protein L23 [bacterium]MBT5015191.1 50S ribosomal protein L23 [bacterium]
MELSIYDIIMGPVLSEDAHKKNRVLGQLVLQVHPKATKPRIKEAMKKLFDVEVETVRTYVRPGKRKRIGKSRLFTDGSDEKRANITLKEGYSLDLFGTQEAVAAEKAAKENK